MEVPVYIMIAMATWNVNLYTPTYIYNLSISFTVPVLLENEVINVTKIVKPEKYRHKVW